eukprot:tig00000670_g3021.t1
MGSLKLKGPMPKAPTAKSLAAELIGRTHSSRSLAPAAAPADPAAECPCSATRAAAAATLAPFLETILPLLPASGTKSSRGGYDFNYFLDEIRTVFIVFGSDFNAGSALVSTCARPVLTGAIRSEVSFPELDTINRSIQEGAQWHATRFAQIAKELDGDVNKVFLVKLF